mmetsp:Transcript_22041/g.47933  ORF Transcript_22041/g.47933 Transcript_22041/m.47933 type:complete len:402 (-) Transcript_22041:504-1709(-)
MLRLVGRRGAAKATSHSAAEEEQGLFHRRSVPRIRAGCSAGPTRSCRKRIRAAFLLLAVIVIVAVVARNAMHNPRNPARTLVVAFLRRVAPMALSHFRPLCSRYRAHNGGASLSLLRRGQNGEGERQRKKLRIGVALQMYPPPDKGWTPDYLATFRLAEKNRLRYCNLHGYEYLNGTAWAEQRPELRERLGGRNVWLKSLFVLDVLRSRGGAISGSGRTGREDGALDYVLFLDADAIIMDFSRSLTSLVYDLNPDEGIVVAPEAREDAFINAGGFVVASNAVGLNIIEAWAEGAWTGLKHDQPYFNNLFDDNGYLKPWRSEGKGGGNTSTTLVSSGIQPRYKLVPPCALQSGGGIEWSTFHGRIYAEGFHAKGDFAVHFYGRPDKVQQMEIASDTSMGFIS